LVTTFTHAECEKLTSALRKVLLPYSGVVRTFPLALVHGPLCFQGLNVPHLYTSQGTVQILNAIRYSISDSIPGHLSKCSAEHLKLEIGCNGPLFSSRFPLLSDVVTDSWWKCIWEFLFNNGMSLSDDLPDFPLYREHDSLIMERFLSVGFRGIALHTLNTCRKYLKVLCLSELLLVDGSGFVPGILDGTADAAPSPFDWPEQGRPNYAAWCFWSRAVQRICFVSRD
jgi:hypothetical protein